MWYNDFFTDKTTNDAKQILLKEYIKSVKKLKHTPPTLSLIHI